MNTEDFTGNVIGVVIATIVVCLVAVPIIQSATSAEGFDPTLKTIIDVIPIFLVLAVLMAVTYMFIQKKRSN